MRKIIYILFLFFAFLVYDQYINCPKFEFSKSKPFSGDFIYNPYQNLNLNNGKIANFHGHTHSWLGLTNGKSNPENVSKRYKILGFDVAAVSQYHWIEKTAKNIPDVYEHGINMFKTHQLVIGSNNVLWKEYYFPQTLYNKQYILKRLAENPNNVVVINHPVIRKGYNEDDFKNLKYYDCIEALRPNANSVSYWDTALSYGNPVYILANDDFHNVDNDNEIGNYANLIYSNDLSEKNLIYSLKRGASVAVSFQSVHNKSLLQRKTLVTEAKKLILGIKNDDTKIVIETCNDLKNVSWIGQKGIVKKIDSVSQSNTNYSGSSSLNRFIYTYEFKKEDTYIRAELFTKSGIRLYLNPFFRHENLYLASRNERARNILKNNSLADYVKAGFFVHLITLRFYI